MGGAVQIGVVGEGLTAAALALALCHTARSCVRPLETLLYAGAGPSRGTPRIVTPQCRARLALLGCSLPVGEPTTPLVGIRVLSRGARSWLPYPPGVVTLGVPERDALTEALTARAALAGARVRPWTVERSEVLSLARSPGRVLRSHGLVARADVVVLALEPGDASSAAAEADCRAPLLEGVEAWLTARRVPPYGQLLLAPAPAVDALLLLPVPAGIYALAFGRALDVVDLSLLLVEAARDGLLEPGFTVRSAGRRQLPAGSVRRLSGPGTLAIGPDALGHPLDLSLTPTLALATRAAKALVAAPEPPRSLGRALAEVGLDEIRAEVQLAAGLWRTLRRAGPEAAHLFRVSRDPTARAAEVTLAGLERLGVRRLRRAARWEAFRELFLARSRRPDPGAVLLQPPRQSRLFYVVDDDLASRESICEQLQLSGAEVQRLESELDLVSAVARTPPAAVLLDVVLERVDGIRLCRALVSHPATRGTPVYLMSGMPGATMRRQALEAGATAFLVKPLDSAAFALLAHRHGLPAAVGVHYRSGTPASSHTAA
jgi:CheY-like chemotaxis protein